MNIAASVDQVLLAWSVLVLVGSSERGLQDKPSREFCGWLRGCAVESSHVLREEKEILMTLCS